MFYDESSRVVNYHDVSLTENTRATYPLEYIPGAKLPAVGGHPKNIIFLTCDAFGVLPPVAKLTPEQAMYHFMAGYTAKVAGTEVNLKFYLNALIKNLFVRLVLLTLFQLSLHASELLSCHCTQQFMLKCSPQR